LVLLQEFITTHGRVNVKFSLVYLTKLHLQYFVLIEFSFHFTSV